MKPLAGILADTTPAEIGPGEHKAELARHLRAAAFPEADRGWPLRRYAAALATAGMVVALMAGITGIAAVGRETPRIVMLPSVRVLPELVRMPSDIPAPRPIILVQDNHPVVMVPLSPALIAEYVRLRSGPETEQVYPR